METDSGFAAVLGAIERDVLASAERRLLKKRWRRSRRRTVASPSGALAWLERLHDPAAPKAAAPEFEVSSAPGWDPDASAPGKKT